MAVTEDQILSVKEVTLNRLQTFAAFEGLAEGNTVKGVSIIQEGPALGHGVWVDKTMLSQVRKLGKAAGRVKAKINHWSGIQDTVGYYENFRISGNKCLADLTFFESHEGTQLMKELIETVPKSFGVSIMFRPDEAEYDKTNDRYNARVRELYSADFVDTPAANRDGVFEEGIDSGENDMANDKPSPPAADAFDAKAAINALESKIAELTSALAAKADKPAEQPAPEAPKPDAAFAAITEKLASLETALKSFAAAPPTQTQPAPPSEAGNNDQPKPVTYAEAKTEYIGKATGLDRTRLSMAFDANPQLRPAHLR